MDKAILPHGLEVYYRYEKDSVLPTAIREGKFGKDTFRFIWDGLRLQSYYCSFKDTHFDFVYTNEGDRVPATATVRGGSLVQQYGPDVQLAMEYNHVGSLQKVFAVLPSGEKLCIKSVTYTAFGIRIEDSNPALYFPLSFAGGLFDPYTGFVRFGVRDYDPALGRFTCPDPARFFGRDNDLYDYCEDDPVNYVDRTGLVPFLLLPLLAMAGSSGIAAVGTYLAATLADRVKGQRTSHRSSAAVDAVNKVAPMVGATVAGGKLAGLGKAAVTASAPAMPALAAQADAAVSTAAGQAMVAGGNAAARGSKAASNMYQKHGPQILDVVGGAKDFASGFMPPAGAKTLPEVAGGFISAADYYMKPVVSGIDSVFSGFDEQKHPRDRNGKFTEK